jgi:Ca2+-binding EF-hand superfamily protein
MAFNVFDIDMSGVLSFPEFSRTITDVLDLHFSSQRLRKVWELVRQVSGDADDEVSHHSP